MNGKTAEILFKIGIILIIAGLLLGAVLGFVLGKGFSLTASVPVWLFSVTGGTGLITVSNSISEVSRKKEDDIEALEHIIERIKKENSEK